MRSPLVCAALARSYLHASQEFQDFTQIITLKSGVPFFFRKFLKEMSSLPASTSQHEPSPSSSAKCSALLSSQAAHFHPLRKAAGKELPVHLMSHLRQI